MSLPPTGRASYSDGILTIVTLYKRGKKTVEHKTCYRVQNIHPTPSVATVAFSLTKGEFVVHEHSDGAQASMELVFEQSGDVYHVFVDEWGPHCDCIRGEVKEKYNLGLCKHVLSLRACKLLE